MKKIILLIALFIGMMTAMQAQYTKDDFINTVNELYKQKHVDADVSYVGSTLIVTMGINWISVMADMTVPEVRQIVGDKDILNELSKGTIDEIGTNSQYLEDLGFHYIKVRVRDGRIYYSSDTYSFYSTV